jgi:hypothetical protein
VLRKNAFTAEELEAIARDFRHAGLSDQEVAVMEFAEKLTLHAHTIRQEDVDKLRAHGLRDEEILDVALAAAARNFWSKTLDALGTETDIQYLDLEPNVRKALQKGRPFAEGDICPFCFSTHITKTIRTTDGRELFFCEPCQMGGVLKPRNRYSELEKNQILEHYERYSPRGIQKTFGVSPHTLARWEKEKKKPARAKAK